MRLPPLAAAASPRGANVPILPVFTENVREAFRVLPFGAKFFYWLFQKTRLPLRPIFGGETITGYLIGDMLTDISALQVFP